MGLGGGVGLMTFIVLTIYSSQNIAIAVSLQTAAVVGWCFALVIGLVLLLSDLTMRLYVSRGRNEEIWELEQTREIQVEGKLKEIRRHCREALLVVPDLKSVSEDSNDYAMSAAIGGSWRSPGEEMRISIASIGDDKWQVKCLSRCLEDSVAFDYGKNFENVEVWLKKMQDWQITAQIH